MIQKKLYMEYELQSHSIKAIWTLISTAMGLKKWLADDVQITDNHISLTWGELWSDHETRDANILELVAYDHIKLQWAEEEGTDTYLEMKIERIDITEDYILCITDYALDGDIDTLREIWNQNLERLHTNTGL